jgi:hypothetical protein
MFSTWHREDHLPNAVGNAAQIMLGQAATGIMLGLNAEAWDVIPRAHNWLLDSAARGEIFGHPPAYFDMGRAEALGLTSWLLGHDARGAFAEAVRRHRTAIADPRRSRPLTQQDLLDHHLPDLVRDCFSAGQYELGAATFAQYIGPPPVDGAAVRTPVELAGWLCRAQNYQATAAWVAVGSRVLGDRILSWMDRGQGLETALWLKVVFFDSGAALTPAAALRRGGELIGALPVDPLASVLLESLGDPVDLDLFAGFVGTVGAAVLPIGTVITIDSEDRAPLSVTVTEPEITTSLNRAISAALEESGPEHLADRLTEAVRGRLVDVDGETPVAIRTIHIS